jgi:alpha-glucosidase
MQWSGDVNAGFTSADPWLPVAKDFRIRNVNQQLKDHKSFLSLYKSLLSIRNQSDALKYGSYKPLDLDPNIFGFIRENGEDRLMVLLNFVDKEIHLDTGNVEGDVICSTYLDNEGLTTKLRSNEGIIVRG